ncbi:putative phage abortive infection protein [Acinetobacter venetianus]|uniref:putative phage abortive infection protein n=1 Tax=Acinetobacter venetianus TaxID=52133 RepID=UPI003F8EC69E
MKTKLKIDVCKLSVFIVISGCIGYLIYLLLKYLYFPYFNSVIKFENGAISLISQSDKGTSLIGDWGTFGDFIGGTLNPILTFISVCLILFTVYQNKKALDFNSEELALSRKAQQDSAKSQQLIQKTQNLQQFDSLFFSLLDQFKQQQDKLCTLNIDDESKVDQIYQSVFVKHYLDSTYHKRARLLQYHELNQYFICLFQLFKLINTRINRSPNDNEKIEEWGDYALEKQYANILRALIPQKLQQLLFLNVCMEFDEYKWYLSYYSFLEHMPFHNLGKSDDILCIDILLIIKEFKFNGNLPRGDFQIFGNSLYFNMLLNESCYADFIESDENICSLLDFMQNKFLTFHEIICFFENEKNPFLLNQPAYQVVVIINEGNNLRIIFGENRELNEVDKSELDREFIVPYSKIYFDRYGLKFEIGNDSRLALLGTKNMTIVKERAKKVCYSEKIIIKENPL